MPSELRIVVTIVVLLSVPLWSWAQDQQLTGATPAPVAQASATLADVAPGGVIVTFEEGDLMIRARDAPLVDVLRAVCRLTGAKLEFQSNPGEPVVGIVGPGSPREVLASLLIGSRLNYVLQASDADPTALAEVLILPSSTYSAGDRRLGQEQASQNYDPSVSTDATSIADNSGSKALTELLMQAKAEVAAAVDLPQDDGSANDITTAGSDQKVDITISKEAEAQLRAIENAFNAPDGVDTPSPQTAQPSGVQASDADSDATSNAPSPFRAKRKRR